MLRFRLPNHNPEKNTADPIFCQTLKKYKIYPPSFDHWGKWTGHRSNQFPCNLGRFYLFHTVVSGKKLDIDRTRQNSSRKFFD